MNYLWILLATVLVVDCRRAYSDDDSTNCLNKDIDSYVDKILKVARKELDDPMRLPPKSTFVDLSDGVLWGLSELTRVGPAKITCEGDVTTIQIKFTTPELKGRYTWTKERGPNKSPREGYVVIISDDFEADTTVVIEKKKDEVTHPRLEKFVIKRFKDVKIEMTGMGYFTWALGEMTTLMSGIFHRVIASSVEKPILEALERSMREINLE